jgi:predicted N-acetyltransferase YhbS
MDDVALQTLPPLTPERPEQAPDVEALIDVAFGPGRHAKAAERLREGNAPDLSLSRVAVDEERVVGCSRIWPIHIGETPALLLGPFAVAPAWRSKGLGAALIEASCEAARAAGHALILLVGDAPYFQRMDFHPVDPKTVTMPGPVDPRRVLVKALRPGADEGLQGAVTAG